MVLGADPPVVHFISALVIEEIDVVQISITARQRHTPKLTLDILTNVALKFLLSVVEAEEDLVTFRGDAVAQDDPFSANVVAGARSASGIAFTVANGFVSIGHASVTSALPSGTFTCVA
jgi:hypothetical protein